MSWTEVLFGRPGVSGGLLPMVGGMLGQNQNSGGFGNVIQGVLGSLGNTGMLGSVMPNINGIPTTPPFVGSGSNGIGNIIQGVLGGLGNTGLLGSAMPNINGIPTTPPFVSQTIYIDPTTGRVINTGGIGSIFGNTSIGSGNSWLNNLFGLGGSILSGGLLNNGSLGNILNPGVFNPPVLDANTADFAKWDYLSMVLAASVPPITLPSYFSVPQDQRQLYFQQYAAALAQPLTATAFMNSIAAFNGGAAITNIADFFNKANLPNLGPGFTAALGGNGSAVGQALWAMLGGAAAGTITFTQYSKLYLLNQVAAFNPNAVSTALTSGIDAALNNSAIFNNGTIINTQPQQTGTPQELTNAEARAVMYFGAVSKGDNAVSQQDLTDWIKSVLGVDLPTNSNPQALLSAVVTFMNATGMPGFADDKEYAYFATLVNGNPNSTLASVLAFYLIQRQKRNLPGALITTGANVNGQIGPQTVGVGLTREEFKGLWLKAAACISCQTPTPIQIPISWPQQPPVIIQQPAPPAPVINNTFNPTNNVKVEVNVDMPETPPPAPKKPEKKKPETPKPEPEKFAFRIHGDPYMHSWDGSTRMKEGGDLSFKKATSIAFSDGSKMIVQTSPAGQTKQGDDLTFSSKLIYISPTGEVVYVSGIAQNQFKRVTGKNKKSIIKVGEDIDGDVEIKNYKSLREFLADNNDDASLLEVYNEVTQKADGWHNASGLISGTMSEGSAKKKITSAKAATETAAEITDADGSDGTVAFTIDGKTFEIDEKFSEIIYSTDGILPPAADEPAEDDEEVDEEPAETPKQREPKITATIEENGKKRELPITINRRKAKTSTDAAEETGDGE